MSIGIVAILGEKWSHNGCPKLQECDKDRFGLTKKTGLEHACMKMTKPVQIDALWSLISMPPLARNHCFHFSRFAQSVPNLVAKSLRNWVPGVSMGAQRRKERGSENIEKMPPQKYQQMSQIRSQRRVPESVFFMVFRVPIPGWAPRRPQAGSKAQKHVKMEAWRWILGYFITMISYSLETLGRCFHEQPLDNIGC